MAEASPDVPDQAPARRGIGLLSLGALGVVFGDIGTSPLYAVRQILHDAPGFATDHAAILGSLSLILWSVVLVVCVKYLALVTRADHDGEGGTLAMLGLLHTCVEREQDQTRGDVEPAAGEARSGLPALPSVLTLLVLFASALLFGDGMVTPAISVLSAVEGLDVVTASLHRVVLPIALVVLVALFALQSRGTGQVGRLFGPVMLAWFAAIGVAGLAATLRHPAVLAAFDPLEGLRFLVGHGWLGYATLGSVVLAFSGAEALFADLGQFGRRPITLAWYCVVLPGLLLNYLGQGATLLADPKAAGNPFFGTLPHWAVLPMVALSTLAAIIASQALISGAFSLAQQAVSMGYAPRLAIVHTSEEERGQVYMPGINLVLALGCLGIVLGFRSSDALGGAYGLAVIGTMTITSVVFCVVMRRVWGWSGWVAGLVLAAFLVVELAFLGANLAKILTGAWLPLAIALVVFAVMAAWTSGRARYRRALEGWSMPLEAFRRDMAGWGERMAGAAVFLTPDLGQVPLVGRHEWLRRQVAYEHVLLLRAVNRRVPFVARNERIVVEALGDGLFRGTVSYGFMQVPRLSAVLDGQLPFGLEAAMFFLPEPLVTVRGRWPDRVRRNAFLMLGRLGLTPVAFFGIPPGQAVMVGMELEL